jgi:hypothetical protein
VCRPFTNSGIGKIGRKLEPLTQVKNHKNEINEYCFFQIWGKLELCNCVGIESNRTKNIIHKSDMTKQFDDNYENNYYQAFSCQAFVSLCNSIYFQNHHPYKAMKLHKQININKNE